MPYDWIDSSAKAELEMRVARKIGWSNCSAQIIGDIVRFYKPVKSRKEATEFLSNLCANAGTYIKRVA